MPSQQITNPLGAYGLPLVSSQRLNEQQLIMAVNNDSTALVSGDVVVWDVSSAAIASGGRLVLKTTTANSVRVAGVVSTRGNAEINADTVGVGEEFFLCVGGVALVNIAALTVAADGLLGTSTTSGAADDTATAVGMIGATVGIALRSDSDKDANNCIPAKITMA